MLTAALRQEREQRRIRDLGLTDVGRAARRGHRQAARMLGAYQNYSIALAVTSADSILTEQDIPTDRVGDVVPQSLLTGPGAATLMDSTATNQEFDRLVSSLILDAARTAMTVDGATRPAVTRYVRQVSPPCCGRCAVLAGRVYRYSQGFQRHPRCDCMMIPSTSSKGASLTTDASALFEAGQIHGLSRADTKALNAGADLGRVVNVRNKSAGLTPGSSVLTRGGRPTPQGIYRMAPDDAKALDLLRRYGYVT